MVYLARRLEAARATPSDPGFDTLDRREQEVADWTPADPGPREVAVEAYSNCEEVELLLNGKSLGVQPLPRDASPRLWKVPFEPGSLKAIGRNRGQVAADCELRTAGKPAKIVLAADRKRIEFDFDDVSTVTATVVDEHGVLVPGTDNLIAFRIAGPGLIAAVVWTTFGYEGTSDTWDASYEILTADTSPTVTCRSSVGDAFRGKPRAIAVSPSRT